MTEKGRDGKKLVFTKPISEKLPFQNASLAILDILFIAFFSQGTHQTSKS